jgi:Tol biopolymer transport system component
MDEEVSVVWSQQPLRRNIAAGACALLFACALGCHAPNNGELTTLTGPYFDQEPPGKVAKLFNPPGLFFPGEGMGCSGFLNDAMVFVFTSMKPGGDWRLRPTYVTQLENGRWTKPAIAPFSKYAPYNFTVGPDGQTIYFTTLRSPDKTTHRFGEEANIWAVKLERDGWQDPVMFGASINTDQYYENYPAVTLEGTVYYMSRREQGVGGTDVWRSRNIDGYYAEAENVGPPVNTQTGDADPFVAPDESYLIVCQKQDAGFGQYDLYVYFHLEDGSWSDGVNMGEQVNSPEYEFRPYVTPDGKYLFFTSNRSEEGSIWWVDAGVIEDLNPQGRQNVQ